LEGWDGDTNNGAFVAFRGMGTNAIPPLIDILQSGGPRLQKMISDINRGQTAFRLPFGTPWHRTLAAAWALYAMGTNARPALPALTNLLFHSNNTISSSTALAGLGPDGISSLITALTHKDFRIRFAAASGLGWARSDVNQASAALAERLQDTAATVRYGAVVSLGQLRAQPDIVVPILTNNFSHGDFLLRSLIMVSLAEFGNDARAAIPTLVSALKDPDETVRANARTALERIDPKIAAESSGK
jgi:HEAT repeat protein